MANHYGNTTNYWRAWCEITPSQTDTAKTFTVSGGMQSQNYGFSISSGCKTTITVNGTSKSGSGGLSSAYASSTKTTHVSGKTIKVTRTHSAQTISCSVKSVNSSGYMNGTSSTSWTETVPAKPSYTVSFNANGGSGAPGSQTKWYGETLTLSSTVPTCADYTFNGWATSSGGSVAYSAGSSYTANSGVTLYAVWTSNTYAPKEPTNLEVSRTSDTTQAISWSNSNYALDHYAWSGVKIERSTDGGNYTQISTAGASATSINDTTTSAGHQYTYRIMSYNGAGNSAYTSTVTVYTTPTAPSTITLTKPTTTTVGVAVSGGSSYRDGYEYQVSADSGSTWTAATITNGIDSNPPTGNTQYRVRAYKAQGGSSNATNKLYSAWKVSSTIQTLVAPNAPTVTIAKSVYATDEGSFVVTWKPNHPDGTAQAKAQVEVTVNGTATTVDISGATSSYTYTITDPATVSFRVRTYGLYEAWGAWSSAKTVTIADKPEASFAAPAIDGEVIDALPYEAAFEITDTTGISSLSIELARADGTLVKRETLATDALTWQLSAAMGLANNADYVLTLSVIGGSSLSNTATRSFHTEWNDPNKGTLEQRITDGLGVGCLVGYEDDETLEPVASIDLVRINTDGTRTTLGTDLELQQEVLDTIPPLNVEYQYEVITYAEAGNSTSVVFDAYVDSNHCTAFNFGKAGEDYYIAQYGQGRSISTERAGELYHFADGGETGYLPYFYAIGQLDESLPHEFSVVTLEDYQKVLTLAKTYYEGWMRGDNGERAFCRMTFDLDWQGWKSVWKVSVVATKQAWEEPYYG